MAELSKQAMKAREIMSESLKNSIQVIDKTTNEDHPRTVTLKVRERMICVNLLDVLHYDIELDFTIEEAQKLVDVLQKHYIDLTLKQQIQKALGLPDSSFDSHASDLYVLWSAELILWLRGNYEFYDNITHFTGAKGSYWEGKRALDIPFAAMLEHRSGMQSQPPNK